MPCRTPASRSALIEHCYQEALAIIEENKQVLLALANALISHSLQTLNGSEIDQVISERLARQAMIAEQERRPKWRNLPSAPRRSAPLPKTRRV